MNQHQQSAFSPYRVLDLTEGECMFAGRLMGDLGADVIQIERPGGSPSRKRGPFYKDIEDPEKSLFWYGFCLNKRGITLDIETAEGKETFKRLVRNAHFVFESFEPGYLDSLGLGYKALSRINPGIILASITPFGQTGPKAHYKGSDLIGWASSGMLYSSGDPDRTPSVTSVPLAGQQGATAAVLGALTAHWHRKAGGKGQHVDVSIQEVMEWHTMGSVHFWTCNQIELPRVGWGRLLNNHGIYGRGGFPCADGYATFIASGAVEWMLHATRELYRWIDEEGMLPDWLKGYDWAKLDVSSFESQEDYDRYLEPVKNFLATKLKAELWQAAVDRKMMTAPVRDFKDNFEDRHMRERGFWVDIEHPELGERITYPGACFKMSQSPLTFRQRAPLIGEHNAEVYTKELGMSLPQIESLESRQAEGSTVSQRKALEGVKVVDFGVMGVAPAACRHLADYGATVVRIESHRAFDVLRFTPPYYKFHVDGSMFFGNYNTSKFGVTLDFSKPTGMDICWRLIKWADVMSCGRPLMWMKRWELDYESVRKAKPEIVYYNTSAVGATGPDSGLFGMGGITNALMGVQRLTGWPDRGPSNTCGYLGDSINYVFGAVAILAALEYRDRTGEGQFIDLSQVETYQVSETPWVLDYAVNGRVANRSGNRYPLYGDDAPYGVFPCKDESGRERWAAICVTNDDEWQAFCRVIGQPEWTQQSSFASSENRRQHEDDLERLVSSWTGNHAAEEVEKLMQRAGVPASVVESGRDLMEDPHLKERGYFRSLEHRELGAVPYSGPPFKLSETPDTQFASPCMGEHNEYVFREILGMSDVEIAAAFSEGGATTD